MMNPTLADLVGGIQAVTLSDDEAKRRGTQKTVLERKAPPTFDVLIEIIEMDKLAIHHDVASMVDKMLRGAPPRGRRFACATSRARWRSSNRPMCRRIPTTEAMKFDAQTRCRRAHPMPAIVKVFPYGVSRNRLERAIRELRVPGYISARNSVRPTP